MLMKKRSIVSILLMCLFILLFAGSVQADWIKVPGGKVYLTKKGELLKNGIYKINDKYYCFDKEGLMRTGWVKTAKGIRCFSNTNGAMLIGKKKVGNYIYFFNEKGYRTSGWVTIGTKEYFFSASGKLQTNTLVDGKKYYVGKSGAKKVTPGLVTVGDKTYYVRKNTQIAKNVKFKYNKKVYVADKNGVVSLYKYTKGDPEPVDATMGNRVAKYAKRFVGNPYVYGGTSLTHGADCSGFVMSVFKKFKINLLRTSYEQEDGPNAAQQSAGYRKGKAVKLSVKTLRPGDLLFYGVKGNAGHVAMYIGSKKIVHAADESLGIRIDNYNYNKPVKAMRYW